MALESETQNHKVVVAQSFGGWPHDREADRSPLID